MSISFSGNQNVYDKRHGAEVSPETVARIVRAADLRDGASLLDLASGTGRVALGFARAGFAVTASDVSAEMLTKLREKADGLALHTLTVAPDRLPFADQSQSVITLARALYLITDWENYLDQVSRVLRSGGLFLHEWGNGAPNEPWARLRDELRRRLDARGAVNAFHPGARREAQIERRLIAGVFIRIAEVDSDPGKLMSLDTFIALIEDREASYLWDVPDEIADAALSDLRAWAVTEIGPLNMQFRMPAQPHWRVYRKS